MKKKLIMLTALLAMMAGRLQAQENSVSVGAVEIPQGGTTTMEISLTNGEELTSYQMMLTLPEGVTATEMKKGTRFTEDEHLVSWNTKEDGTVMLTCLSTNGVPLTGNSGVLVCLELSAQADLTTGEVLEGQLTGVTFVTPDGTQRKLADATFTITIGEPVDSRVVLDENSTAEPTPADHVDVRVKRTLTAGLWNTICLPFAMTEAQVKTTFGDDVLLGDFKGYQLNADNSISVEFDQVNAIAENHPYIIKVATDMDEFELDDVSINPQDAEINLGTKRRPKSIIGTYVAETVIDNGCLFLNGGKFWYSTGITVTQGYRAYFDFDDLLPEFEDNYVNARMRIVLNEESLTKVSTMKQPVAKGGRIHNLQGMQVEQLGKGVFIKDGKVIINN